MDKPQRCDCASVVIHTVWSKLSNVCKCAETYYNKSGVCTFCADSTLPNADQSSCICPLVEEDYDTGSNTCVCGSKSWINGGGVCTLCAEGSVPLSTKTLGCACTNSSVATWDASNVCMCKNNGTLSYTTWVYVNLGTKYGCAACPDGTGVEATGLCDCSALANSIWNQTNNVCVCTGSLYYETTSSTCISCPVNSNPSDDHMTCECSLSNTEWLIDCNICDCNTKSYNDSYGECSVCATGSIPNDD